MQQKRSVGLVFLRKDVVVRCFQIHEGYATHLTPRLTQKSAAQPFAFLLHDYGQVTQPEGGPPGREVSLNPGSWEWLIATSPRSGMATDKVGTWANAMPGGTPACKPGTGGAGFEFRVSGFVYRGRGRGDEPSPPRPHPDLVGSLAI